MDIDALLARADLDELIARVDVEAIISRIDIDQVVAKVDVDAVLQRVDIDALLEHTELGSLIARSGSAVMGQVLDMARSQGVGMDSFVHRWVDRHHAARPIAPSERARHCWCRRRQRCER